MSDEAHTSHALAERVVSLGDDRDRGLVVGRDEDLALGPVHVHGVAVEARGER